MQPETAPQGNAEHAGTEPPVETVPPTAGVETPPAETPDASEKATPPEAYSFDYSVYPEGFEVDDAMQAKFSETAKALGLSQDQAQALVAFDAQRTADMAASVEAARTQLMAEWRGQLDADPELGGAKATETRRVAAEAIQQFGGDEFRTLLEQTGLGDHPTLVRVMHRIGVAIAEAPHIKGDAVEVTPRTRADRFYPSNKKQ